MLAYANLCSCEFYLQKSKKYKKNTKIKENHSSLESPGGDDDEEILLDVSKNKLTSVAVSLSESVSSISVITDATEPKVVDSSKVLNISTAKEFIDSRKLCSFS